MSRTQGHSAIGRILCQLKLTVTPAVIEPAFFRFVANRLNHCAIAVPDSDVVKLNFTMTVNQFIFVQFGEIAISQVM
jgi:hypothetical protein